MMIEIVVGMLNGEIYPKDVIQDYNSKIKACFLSMKWLSDKINEGKFNFK